MASGVLNSHQVNYLIWRYLQESGHGEAAVMLQRAWNPNPQNLPFAPYIKTHALITLIQKGLQYHELEQLIDQEGKPSMSPPVSFFGPSTLDAPSPRRVDEGIRPVDSRDARDEKSSRSPQIAAPRDNDVAHTTEAVPQQQELMMGRKSVGVEDGAGIESRMDIEHPQPSPARDTSSPREPVAVDADGDVGMATSPVQEPPSPVYTLSTGQSIGVQIVPTKAADLAPDTTLVDLPGVDHVIKSSWRPHDPLTLTAQGETFCAQWKLSGQRSSIAPALQMLVEDASVTASDWDPSGQMLAVATYKDFVGTITMYDQRGMAVSILPDTPRLVSALRWANRGQHLAIVMSDGHNSNIALWDHALRLDELPLPQGVDELIYDVTWSDDGLVYACGDASVYQCRIEDNVYLSISRRFVSEEQKEPWTHVKTASWAGSSLAVAASASSATIWVPTHDMSVNSAHHADITAIEFRPRSPSAQRIEKDAPLTLATSSMDNTVKLWNINIDTNEILCTHRLFLGESSPALVSTFSPDGYAIAAVSQRELFIWHAERGGIPLATWSLPSDDKVKGEPNQDEESVEGVDLLSLDRTLSWDSDGKKLALGFGSRMAIVNLQR